MRWFLTIEEQYDNDNDRYLTFYHYITTNNYSYQHGERFPHNEQIWLNFIDGFVNEVRFAVHVRR